MTDPDKPENEAPIDDGELLAFIAEIPESVLPHLTEADIREEYRHHYGFNPTISHQ